MPLSKVPDQGTTPRDRVEAFIADYNDAWQRWRRSQESDRPASTMASQAAWQVEEQQLLAGHFVEPEPGDLWGVGTRTMNIFWSVHTPTDERITTIEADGETARVRSVRAGVKNPVYYAYRLSRSSDDWRITRLDESYDPPGTRLIAPDQAAGMLARVSPTSPLPDPRVTLPDLVKAVPDVQAMFAAPNDVVQLGTITTGGVLTIHDLALVDWELKPLTRTVPAGTYSVEVARDRRDVNLAVRLRLSAADPVEWRAAERLDVGAFAPVDCGNVAILDFAALASCEIEHANELYEQVIEMMMDGPGGTFHLGNPEDDPDAVIVESGIGDGCYPIYWGISEDGSVAALLVDFLVAPDDIA